MKCATRLTPVDLEWTTQLTITLSHQAGVKKKPVKVYNEETSQLTEITYPECNDINQLFGEQAVKNGEKNF